MKRRIFALLVVVVSMGLAFVPAAAAGPPIAVSGDWEWNSTIYPDKFAGDNMFFTGFEVSVGSGWSGSFNGTSYDVFKGVFHRSGIANALITVYFKGTVGNSDTGSMVLLITVLLAPGGSEDGSWVIKSAEGGLAGLHGEGKWWFLGKTDTPGYHAGYSGKVHWQK